MYTTSSDSLLYIFREVKFAKVRCNSFTFQVQFEPKKVLLQSMNFKVQNLMRYGKIPSLHALNGWLYFAKQNKRSKSIPQFFLLFKIINIDIKLRSLFIQYRGNKPYLKDPVLLLRKHFWVTTVPYIWICPCQYIHETINQSVIKISLY